MMRKLDLEKEVLNKAEKLSLINEKKNIQLYTELHNTDFEKYLYL